MSGAIVPEVYDPTYGWHPGRPAATRRQAVLIGVLFSVLAVAATLWRSRFAVVAVIALCVHDENGAIGVGVGHKRAGITFKGLLRQLDIDPGEKTTWDETVTLARLFRTALGHLGVRGYPKLTGRVLSWLRARE